MLLSKSRIRLAMLMLFVTACCCGVCSGWWMEGKRVLISLPMSACAGDTFVVVWMVALWMRAILKTSLLGSLFSIVAVCTTFATFFMKFSAKPLPSGCCGAVGLCCIPMRLQYLLNSDDAYGGPLSVMIWSQVPCVAHILSRIGRSVSADVDVVMSTVANLVRASMETCT